VVPNNTPDSSAGDGPNDVTPDSAARDSAARDSATPLAGTTEADVVGGDPREAGSHVNGSDDVDEPPRSRSKSFGLFVRDVLFILLAAIIISFLIKTFLIRSFYIPSGSMEDTLLINDRIIVNQLTPDLIPVGRGDVVVFTDPGGWLPFTPEPQTSQLAKIVDGALSVVGLTAPDSNDHLIKRVIGLPGDHVICCNDFGQMSVNGVPLEEPYTKLDTPDSAAAPTEFDITVPAGHLWVMGDNRYHSADSAYQHANDTGFEFVPIENVVGRAMVISWPVARWTTLDNYPVVFSGIESRDPE